MPYHWNTDILRLLRVKQQLAALDRRHYPCHWPTAGARDERLCAAEALLGCPLEAEYRALLQCADGWRAVYGTVDLFGTRDLLGSPAMATAWRRLAALDAAGALSAAGIARSEALPIAAGGLDLFVQLHPHARFPGHILWFAHDEIERYTDFPTFFEALIDANRDVITLLGYEGRLNAIGA